MPETRPFLVVNGKISRSIGAGQCPVEMPQLLADFAPLVAMQDRFGAAARGLMLAFDKGCGLCSLLCVRVNFHVILILKRRDGFVLVTRISRL